ncbi:TPA: hypothetical protein DCZ36_03145 [Candidatus Gracilibacteria bacterium]|nr:hypothetical protein [Candidatus Gracilibacteria bacterium]
MIALDIGAGNTSFGKDLRRLNPQITTVICADPYIKKDFEEYGSIGSLLEVTVHNAYAALSRLTKVSTPGEVEKVVRKSKKGIFKAIATYENTGLPDESVDILTLNSPNPLFPPSEDDFLEFHRVLKKGGIFYFGHSTDIRHTFDEEHMILVGKGSYSYRGNKRGILPEYNLIFPMSPVIASNIITRHLWERGHRAGIEHMYHPSRGEGPRLHPNWRAWVKK